jgi:hypothetical protein
MPISIVRLTDKNQNDYFLEWSTIVDAPVTYGMNEEEFLEYLKTYQKCGLEHTQERIERAKKTGTSSLCYTFDELISFNRAGENETCLTYDELVEKYCI